MRFLRSLWYRQDDGVTLVELSVVMVLLGVISSLVAGAFLGAQQIFRINDNQTRGLQQVRVAAERLDRDIRDARAVLCNPAGTDATLAATDPNCTYHLQLWIDYNSDYVQESNETVTWQLKPSSVANHYSLVRTVNGLPHDEADAIVRQVAFTYNYPPASTISAPGAKETTEVDVNMTYDALHKNGGSTNRSVVFSDELRNAS